MSDEFRTYEKKNSIELDRMAMDAYKSNDNATALKITNFLLNERRDISEDSRIRLEMNRKWIFNRVKDERSTYPYKVVATLTNRNPNPSADVTVVMTTCKRFELFTKTVNSLLNCLASNDLDDVQTWLCVDDNSDECDRRLMRVLYPFMTFVEKKPDERGHAQSMNFILDAVETPYWLHLEDDWLFCQPLDYIARARRILEEEFENNVAQVLFNRNYAEVIDRHHAVSRGGWNRCVSYGKKGLTPLRYRLHEHYPHGSEGMKWYQHRNNNEISHTYWPHFSFRPSLIRIDAVRTLGKFDECLGFENVFAKRYAAHGFRSAALDSLNLLHLGRYVRDRDGAIPNAYKLNNVPQWSHNTEPTPVIDRSVSTSLVVDVKSIFSQHENDIVRNVSQTLLHFLSRIRDPFSFNVTFLTPCPPSVTPNGAVTKDEFVQSQLSRTFPFASFVHDVENVLEEYILWVVVGQIPTKSFAVSDLTKISEKNFDCVTFKNFLRVFDGNLPLENGWRGSANNDQYERTTFSGSTFIGSNVHGNTALWKNDAFSASGPIHVATTNWELVALTQP